MANTYDGKSWDEKNIDYDEVRRLAGRILAGNTFDELVEIGRINQPWQADCYKLAATDPNKYANYYPDAELGMCVLSDEFVARIISEIKNRQF